MFVDSDGSVPRQRLAEKDEMRVLPVVDVDLTDEARRQAVCVLADIMAQWWSCAPPAADTEVPGADG